MSEGEAQRPSDEELIQKLEEELRQLKVSDLLVQTLYTVSSLGYRKLSAEDRDLVQAHVAIEALRALLPVIEGTVGDDVARDFRQVTANLQLAYASAVSEPGRAEGQAPTPGESGQETVSQDEQSGVESREDTSEPAESGGQAPGPVPEGDDGGG